MNRVDSSRAVTGRYQRVEDTQLLIFFLGAPTYAAGLLTCATTWSKWSCYSFLFYFCDNYTLFTSGGHHNVLPLQVFKLVLIVVSNDVATCYVNIVYIHWATCRLVLSGSPLRRCQCSCSCLCLRWTQLWLFLCIIYISHTQSDPAELDYVVFLKT